MKKFIVKPKNYVRSNALLGIQAASDDKPYVALLRANGKPLGYISEMYTESEDSYGKFVGDDWIDVVAKIAGSIRHKAMRYPQVPSNVHPGSIFFAGVNWPGKNDITTLRIVKPEYEEECVQFLRSSEGSYLPYANRMVWVPERMISFDVDPIDYEMLAEEEFQETIAVDWKYFRSLSEDFINAYGGIQPTEEDMSMYDSRGYFDPDAGRRKSSAKWPNADFWEGLYDDEDFEEAWSKYLQGPEDVVNNEFNIFPEPSVQGGIGSVFIHDNDDERDPIEVDYDYWCDTEIQMAKASRSSKQYENKYRKWIKNLIK